MKKKWLAVIALGLCIALTSYWIVIGADPVKLFWIALGGVDPDKPFVPPDADERARALGPTKDLSEELKKVFSPTEGFNPIPMPMPNDWLAKHAEQGQTYAAYVRSRPHPPTAPRNKIYLLPLGEFLREASPPQEQLKNYTHLFFGLETEVLQTLLLDGLALTTRKNVRTGNRQILTGDVLALLKHRLPKDAYAILAVTMEDLYPQDNWNFVFGQASLRERVGVYSFARYDPAFYGKKHGEDYSQVLLRRSLQVLTHEVGHMFGLEHCTFYHCLMNGTNHLNESDAQPMSLCPVCLRKLHHLVQFDPVERYRKLQAFYMENKLEEESKWTEAQIKRITGQ